MEWVVIVLRLILYPSDNVYRLCGTSVLSKAVLNFGQKPINGARDTPLDDTRVQFIEGAQERNWTVICKAFWISFLIQ